MQDSVIDRRLGTMLGTWRLQERLGLGTTSVVYLGVPLDGGAAVAIKMLRTEAVRQPLVVQRFRREAQVYLRLRHPNIAAGLSAGDDYLVLEFISDTTLDTVMQPGGLPLARFGVLFDQLLSAVSYLHEAGIVHRDLKPANVMLGPDDSLKLVDFGLARGDRDTRLTPTHVSPGSPAYMAPEHLQGAPASTAGDQYALGVMAYELLCGHPPTEGRNTMELVYRKVNFTPLPLRTHRPDIDPGLEAMVMRMLADTPEARFPSVQAAAAALHA